MRIKLIAYLSIFFFFFSIMPFKADTQEEISQKEEEIKELASNLTELEDKVNEKEASIDDLNSQISDVNEDIIQVSNSIEGLKVDIDSKKELTSKSLIAIQYASMIGPAISSGEIEIDSMYNYSLLISFLFSDVKELISQQKNLESENIDLQLLNTDLESTKTELEKEQKELAEQEKELQDQSDQIKQELADLNEQLEQEQAQDEIGDVDTSNSYVSDEEKVELMTNVGISTSDQIYADYIIYNESGWNYQATNSISGAYGLCQALPASKMADAGSDWQTNPQTQVEWCDMYATSRYGNWEDAYNFWITNHWW